MKLRSYFILLPLLVIFILPGIAALMAYNHPQWLNSSTTNQGKLLKLTTPLPINSNQKWSLILWYPQRCEKNCLTQVDKLARIRLALGRHLYEVNMGLVMPERNKPISPAMEKVLTEEAITLFFLNEKTIASHNMLDQQPQIFIADPQGYLVLTYEKNSPPQAIFHDLKKLLKS